MNFTEYYFTEKKKKKKKPSKQKFSMASYFNSDKYDKNVSGTLDIDPGIDPGIVGETLDTKVDADWESSRYK